MIHAVHEVRRPTRVSLDAHDFELRMALEDAAEDKRPDDVLVAADDRHKRVDLRTAVRFRNAFVRS